MPLTKVQKQQVKQEWDRMIRSVEKFSAADVRTLYVVDKQPLLDGVEKIAQLLGKIPRATWTRGKQGHG